MNASSANDDDEFWDLLVSLCAHCDLIAQSAERTITPRTVLQKCYRRYASFRSNTKDLQEIMMKVDNDDDASDWIRQYEELLSELYVALEDYHGWVSKKIKETIKDLRALERLQPPTATKDGSFWLCWILWIQRVVRQWRRSLVAEQKVWKEWQCKCLVDAYSDTMNQRMDPSVMSSDTLQLSISDKVMLERLTQILETLEDDDGTAEPVGDNPKSIFENLIPHEQLATTNDTTSETKSIDNTKFAQCSNNIQKAVQEYFASPTQLKPNRFVLLTGEPGSGKSYICEQIRQSIATTFPSVAILVPRVPLDFLGRTVGGAESTWLALLTAIQTSAQPVLVILDSVDDFVSDENVTGGCLRNRLAAGWRMFLDIVLTRPSQSSLPVLVLGTCTQVSHANQTRVDAVFDCRNPSAEARRAFLCTVAGARMENMDVFARERLASVVESSVGRSYGEMAFLVRQVLTKSSLLDLSPTNLLNELRHQFQQHCPPSLSTGATEGMVDLQVLMASDLGATTATRQKPGGLYGKEMETAWRSLQSSIIIPLCRSKELQGLLGSKSEPKKMTGGVLLECPSGCGATALAYETARYVTSIDPSIKFINVSCTSLVHKEVGGSEKALHQLFVAVRQAAPCILLLESIETIAAVRGHDNTTEGTMDRVLSTLLVELDGVESQGGSMAPFAVIGTTHNRNWVDPALQRPGRLGAVLSLGLPDTSTRKAIIHSNMDGAIYSTAVLEHIINKSEGMSGASVIGLCNDLKLKMERTKGGAEKPLTLHTVDMVAMGRR
eukprot:scaffold1450_cov170-Amphora_coffeaeformis.AAC.2